MNVCLALEKVLTALRILGGAAKIHRGLFPSVLDLEGVPVWRLPAPAAGQRQSDRSFPGSNLMHDHVTLGTMKHLAGIDRGADLSEIADAGIRRFVTHCCTSASGLFPWGEHAFWNLSDDCPGNSYTLDGTADGLKHDHLLQAPVWLWEEIRKVDPCKVNAFARGLDNHWRSNSPLEYNRHAPMQKQERIFNADPVSYDFPRHSGFYALDWAFAYRHSAEEAFRSQIGGIVDYWWLRRHSSNALQLSSRFDQKHSSYGDLAYAQTLSLGVSLLETAAELGRTDPALAAICRERGEAYVSAFLQGPHAPENGVVVSTQSAMDKGTRKLMPLWGSIYGDHTAATAGLLLLRACDFLERTQPLIAFCEKLATGYPTLPSSLCVPAKDAGQVVGFFTELSLRGGRNPWRQKAWDHANQSLDIYLDKKLPRCAAGLDWYESQMLPGHLLSCIARLACMEQDASVSSVWEADFSLR